MVNNECKPTFGCKFISTRCIYKRISTVVLFTYLRFTVWSVYTACTYQLADSMVLLLINGYLQLCAGFGDFYWLICGGYYWLILLKVMAIFLQIACTYIVIDMCGYA